MEKMFGLKKGMSGLTGLEAGHVLEVGDDRGMFLDDAYNVYATIQENFFMKVGQISTSNLKHFIQEESKPADIIDKIVFLGDFTYGIKQFEDPFEAFKNLSEDVQREIIDDYLELRYSRDNYYEQ